MKDANQEQRELLQSFLKALLKAYNRHKRQPVTMSLQDESVDSLFASDFDSLSSLLDQQENSHSFPFLFL